MSSKSTPQILSLKDEYAFRLLNFLIMGSSSSLASFIFSLMLLPTVFLSGEDAFVSIYKPY